MGISSIGYAMSSVIPIIVIVGFVFVFGAIIGHLVKGTKQWKKNNDSPVLTVDATVVAKRADVHHSFNSVGPNNMNSGTSSTTYYATFQVISGDRLELCLRDTEYGCLMENDVGKLTFQGTRYLGFVRDRT